LLSEAKPENAVHLVVSSQALGMDQIGISISEITETRVRVSQRIYQNLRQFEQAVDAAATSLGPREHGLLVLSGPWFGTEIVKMAARHTRVRQALKDGRYGMQVLLVAYEVDWRELDPTGDGDDIISLSPLGDGSLRQFIKRHWGASLNFDEEQIKEIRRLTGGFPYFLHQPKGRTTVEVLESLKGRAEELYNSPDLFKLLGLNDGVLLKTLNVIRALGYQGETSDELMRSEGIEDPQAALRQLERLGIVERYANQQSYEPERRLNPFVESALAQRKV
jgi:hypothetical protein